MVVNKPTIIIYTQEADLDLLHEVCSGIEEEGLLFEVHEKSGELDELAHAPRFWQCRNLGANSARAVKKMPFKAIYRGE